MIIEIPSIEKLENDELFALAFAFDSGGGPVGARRPNIREFYEEVKTALMAELARRQAESGGSGLRADWLN